MFTLLFDLLSRAAILLFLLNLSEEFVSRISNTWMLFSASCLIISVMFFSVSSGSSKLVRIPSSMIGRLPYLKISKNNEHRNWWSKTYLTDSCLTCLTFSLNVTWGGDQKHDFSQKPFIVYSSYLHSETLMNFTGLFDINTQLKNSILVKLYVDLYSIVLRMWGQPVESEIWCRELFGPSS